jgi:hypothetical protein
MSSTTTTFKFPDDPDKSSRLKYLIDYLVTPHTKTGQVPWGQFNEFYNTPNQLGDFVAFIREPSKGWVLVDDEFVLANLCSFLVQVIETWQLDLTEEPNNGYCPLAWAILFMLTFEYLSRGLDYDFA